MVNVETVSIFKNQLNPTSELVQVQVQLQVQVEDSQCLLTCQ